MVRRSFLVGALAALVLFMAGTFLNGATPDLSWNSAYAHCVGPTCETFYTPSADPPVNRVWPDQRILFVVVVALLVLPEIWASFVLWRLVLRGCSSVTLSRKLSASPLVRGNAINMMQGTPPPSPPADDHEADDDGIDGSSDDESVMMASLSAGLNVGSLPSRPRQWTWPLRGDTSSAAEGMPLVREMLMRCKLDQYADVFQDKGFDDLCVSYMNSACVLLTSKQLDDESALMCVARAPSWQIVPKELGAGGSGFRGRKLGHEAGPRCKAHPSAWLATNTATTSDGRNVATGTGPGPSTGISTSASPGVNLERACS